MFGHPGTNNRNELSLEHSRHQQLRMPSMKYSPKIAAIAVAAVLSIAGLTAVTATLADSGHRGEWSKPGMGKHHGGKHHGGKNCDRHGRGGPQGMRGPDYLAKKLSVMETEIGIRANQIDDWRDFTDALQATMKRPMMGPGGMGGPGGMMKPGDDAEPFSLADRFADAAIERGKSAEELKAAVAKLRTALTPEQLDKVKAIEARFRARMARAHGWKHGGKSHHGKGPHGNAPDAGKPAPEAAPAAKPDVPDGDDADDNDNDDSL